MIQRSTLQLLRFHFSFFLLPIFLFALGQVNRLDLKNAILVFFILHFLVYPASNGYNSYMDRDTESIGGIKNPQLPTRQLFYVTIILDSVAVLLSLLISINFAAGILIYILVSRAYSYRGIRLKKYPVLGYLTVVIFQGTFCYLLVLNGCSVSQPLTAPTLALVASGLLIGGFYPLTQIYQHRQDKEDGIKTLSILLGYRGTFIFTAIIYSLAMTSLALYFSYNLEFQSFLIFQIWLLPVLVYFVWWMAKVWKDSSFANFKNTMRMNTLASACTNAAFLTILILNRF